MTGAYHWAPKGDSSAWALTPTELMWWFEMAKETGMLTDQRDD